MFARWQLAIRALNSFPLLATSAYRIYPTRVCPCSSCIEKVRSSIRSRLGDRPESQSLKVGSPSPFTLNARPRLSYCATILELETLLIECGAIIPSQKKPPAGSKDDLDEESEEEVSQIGSKPTWANYSSKTLRNAAKKDDSDSDFDL